MRMYGSNDARGDWRVPEDVSRCAEEVATPPYYIDFHQCTRKRGHGPDGLYCKQHAKGYATVELEEGD
jgi:hypothetical protein